MACVPILNASVALRFSVTLALLFVSFRSFFYEFVQQNCCVFSLQALSKPADSGPHTRSGQQTDSLDNYAEVSGRLGSQSTGFIFDTAVPERCVALI